MPAIHSISAATGFLHGGLGPIRRVQAVDSHDPAASRQDEPMRHGAVVYSFSAHARMHAVHDNDADAVIVDERRSPPRVNSWGPSGIGPELPDSLPDRLSDFHVGSALEAQLVTPDLDQLHAAVMARRAG